MKLLPVFILLVVPFQSNADTTGDGPKIVYSCPGRDVDLKFNTPGPITYSHLVGTKGGSIDANLLNMSVRILNNFKTEVNATAGNKVEFNGNLFAGHAWFKFKNFKPNDRDMILRISTYKEFGTSPSKQDFKLILSKDCAQQKNGSAGNSTSVSSNSTANLVPLPPEKTTPNSKGESYPDGTSPDNSIEPSTNHTSGNSIPVNKIHWEIVGPMILVAVLCLFIFLIIIVYCCKKEKASTIGNNDKKYQQIPQQPRSENANGNVSSYEDPERNEEAACITPQPPRSEYANGNVSSYEDPERNKETAGIAPQPPRSEYANGNVSSYEDPGRNEETAGIARQPPRSEYANSNEGETVGITNSLDYDEEKKKARAESAGSANNNGVQHQHLQQFSSEYANSKKKNGKDPKREEEESKPVYYSWIRLKDRTQPKDLGKD